MSSSQQQRRGGGRGGNHRGTGNRDRSYRGGNSPRRTNNAPSFRQGDTRQRSRSIEEKEDSSNGMRDEEVLIAFMPYLKGSDSEAAHIHEEYQRSNDQRAFLQAARDFLERQRHEIPANNNTNGLASNPTTPVSKPSTDSPLPVQSNVASTANPPATPFENIFGTTPTRHLDPSELFLSKQNIHHNAQNDSSNNTFTFTTASNLRSSDGIPLTDIGTESSSDLAQANNRESSVNSLQLQALERGLGALMDDDPVVSIPTNNHTIWGSSIGGPITPPRPNSSHGSNQEMNSPWKNNRPADSTTVQSPPHSTIISDTDDFTPEQKVNEPTKKKELPLPKRLWTHFEEQPGRIFVNGRSGENPSVILNFSPREELMAQWSLPAEFVKKYAEERYGQSASFEKALAGLTVGLFRRGCIENGTQASIISKCVVGDDSRKYDCWKDSATNTLRGQAPFYSPRTPGYVLFRLYWEDNPLYTLAMGPTILVKVSEADFESSIRFILGNFKGKKTNPTSLSSLHSLAAVLETHLTRPNDSAARATWGCIQEARKVVDACALEYKRMTAKLSELEESVEQLKKQVETDDAKSQELSVQEDGYAENDDESNPVVAELREKTRTLMSGRASCERKWRDSQLSFASILKSVVTNNSMSTLLRRDLINKMRLEFELWCPLTEEFALPDETSSMWYEALQNLNRTITSDDFRQFTQARAKMQSRILGFEPNTSSLVEALFPGNRGSSGQRAMDPGAVSVFNNLSAAMGQYFQTLFANEDTVVRQRELIRERTEQLVRESGAFPDGTRVAIFGSSANGFGSPKSDIDMCLQIPGAEKLIGDESGSQAMAKLADYLSHSGMKEVDTARLSARIPIIMYRCINPLSSSDEEETIDCDLSMHNPLAVLNTALLRTYAEITPITRVLASVIKRWAKARDINEPARHTLSSYGYIIMLLHFMTYHKRTGNGLVTLIASPEGNINSDTRSQTNQQPPLLPNLQWVDPMWPNFPRGTPYRELQTLPIEPMSHPIEDKRKINAYFFRPKTPNEKALLQMLFPGEDLSLAILLASFFRYYAYEFDYKRHVVSLHSNMERGIVEREVKAELDGWRNYSASLTIEDPFETFYDIAHVLRGGYYHRIRREFAVAYTKIVDVASGREGAWGKGDLRSMSGQDLLDWICEPVVTDKEPMP